MEFDCREQSSNSFPGKLSNGTISKGLGRDPKDSEEGKDAAEKQQSCPEETNLLVSTLYP